MTSGATSNIPIAGKFPENRRMAGRIPITKVENALASQTPIGVTTTGLLFQGILSVDTVRAPTQFHATNRWVCLYTQPHRERMAVGSLRDANFEVYLPICSKLVLRNGKRVPTRTPLFPRYLLIKSIHDHTHAYFASHLPGVTSFAGRTLEQSWVADEIIKALQARHDEAGVIAFDPAGIKPGENIKLLNGPFRGFSAVFEEPDDRKRSYILLNLLGKEHRVLVQNRDLEVTA